MRTRWFWATTALCLVAFAIHFRPWQGGLMEDWVMASLWDQWSLSQIFDAPNNHGYIAGRPFSLVPLYLGFSLSNGGFVGPFFVLGLISVFQALGTMWALRPVVHSTWLRFALATLISLHPWWDAGQLLRFLGAQASVMWSILWLGCAIRHLKSAGGGWLIGIVIFPLLGLMTYQAPAAAIGLAALGLTVVVPARRIRHITMVTATWATIAAAAAWTIFGAPLVAPNAYEANLMRSHGIFSQGLGPLIHGITDPLVTAGRRLILFAVVLAIILTGLVATRAARTWQVATVLVSLVLAPATTLVFMTDLFRLNDPERAAIPVGLSLWFTAGLLAMVTGVHVTWSRVLASGAIIASSLGAVIGYGAWTRIAVIQQNVLQAVAPLRAQAPANSLLLIEDETNSLRWDKSWFYAAFEVTYGPGAKVIACLSGAAPPDPVTPLCSNVIKGATPVKMGSVAPLGIPLNVSAIPTSAPSN